MYEDGNNYEGTESNSGSGNGYQDKTLKCTHCDEDFIFSAGEQEFYEKRGFVNEPRKCKSCRDKLKNENRQEREIFIAECASCHGEAKVPFKPREDRPVYCSECFAKMKDGYGEKSSY